jgi:hypothetical protein
MNWEYKREEQFPSIPEGTHRVIIEKADMAQSKRGNDMIVLQLAVSGYSWSLWYYLVFMDDHPEITNRNLTQIFDSFGIEEGNFSLSNWIGKAGACTVKHDEEGRAKVGYFIKKSKQDTLPPWKGEVPVLEGGFRPVAEDDIPF